MKSNANMLIWQPNSYNARGQVTNYLLGDDYRTIRNLDSYGFPTLIVTQTTGASPDDRQREEYIFDEKRGNIIQRSLWETQAWFENFTYDGMQRLTSETISPISRTTTYYNNGNFTNRSDIGTYHYDDAGPHAVTGLSNTIAGFLPANDQAIDYTAFNKASHISQGNYD